MPGIAAETPGGAGRAATSNPTALPVGQEQHEGDAPDGAREIHGRCGGLPRYGPAMDDADGYFGEQVAAGYDESTADMFEPASRYRAPCGRDPDGTADRVVGPQGPGLPMSLPLP